MRASKLILAVAGLSQQAMAVDYSWQNFASGAYSWGNAANWLPAGIPNANTDTANVSGLVTGGNLSIALNGNQIVAGLTVGATGSPFATDIGNSNSDGGVLILDNNSGAGTATILSAGVGGAVTNITAPVQLGNSVVVPSSGTLASSNFRVEGTGGPVNFLGGLTVFADNNAGDGTLIQRRVLTLNVGSQSLGSNYVFGAIALSQPGAVQRGELDVFATGVGAPTVTFAHGGTVTFNGVISDGGFAGGVLRLGFNGGANSQPTVPTTYVINQNNTYSGQTNLSKGIYVLNTNQPFGTAQINAQYAASTYAANLVSGSDDRVLSNNIQLQNFMTVSGEHSLTLSGNIYQSNNRELQNLLPADKTLTINGFVTAATSTDGATVDARRFTFDGSGTTIVNGPIYNHRRPWFGPASAVDLNEEIFAYSGVTKKGSGVLILSPTVLPTVDDGAGGTYVGATSTYRGITRVQGGLLQFSSKAAYGVLDTPYTAGPFSGYTSGGTEQIQVSVGAAVGVLTGSLDAGFITKLNASTLATGSSGGLALSPADATVPIDFTSIGNGVTRMSLGAVLGGTTYTGAITPNATLGYRLGGGGKLTLPNANQLTGAVPVTVTNGGEVVIANNNGYTGVTTIRGDYIDTGTPFARVNANNVNIASVSFAERVASTLTVASLANGGVASPLGASTSDAANLVISGATLKYTGGGHSTDRLFTISPVGATLDASGSGAVNFTNTGALVVADLAPRTATLQSGGSARVLASVGDTSELALGMTITAESGGAGTFFPAGTTITTITPTNIAVNNNSTVASGSITGATLIFGNQNRNLNLTGSNAGANTLAAQLNDSAAGKLGLVKSGSGAWNVTGASNSYTGGVTVNAGTLTVKKLVGNGTTTINGGTLRISPGGSVGDASATSVFVENGFGIAGGASPAGRLDIGKNGVVFDYTTTSPKATIAALIAAGRSGGAWTGNGITSSDAAANATAHGVGYAEASSIGSPATFLGQSIDATAVVARYTRLGDANLTGNVDLDDFTSLAANFGLSGEWSSGDFDYSGSVNLDDFTILAANFGLSAAGDLARGSAVPEPATLSLLAAGALLLGRRRR